MDSSTVIPFMFFMPGISFVSGIGQPYKSPWYITYAQANNFSIPHPLGEYPAKVDVQIRVAKNNNAYIFSGMGSAQLSDNSDTPYGGIVYTYNNYEVRLYVPLDSGTGSGKGVLVYTGGSAFDGPFMINAGTALVRIRAWRMCDFPPPVFTSAGIHTIQNTAGESFQEISHGLGIRPDYVVVQLKLSDGYISEAEGAVFKGISYIKYDTVCGTVFAYNNQSIRIWSAQTSTGDGFVFCVTDGWGPVIHESQAQVFIQAWVFAETDVKFSYNELVEKWMGSPNSIGLGDHINTDNHLFLLQVQAIGGNNDGYVFNGAGTSMTDGSLSPFGGIVYCYTEQEVLIWRPADSYSNGFMAYTGGDWGAGQFAQNSQTANIIVEVFDANSDESACGKGVCYSDWSALSLSCDCTGTEKMGSYCNVDEVCPIPDIIPNSDVLYDGLKSGNMALYSCRAGFHGNREDNIINCTGTSWTSTAFACLAVTSPVVNCPTYQNITNITDFGKESSNNVTPDPSKQLHSSDCPDPPDIVNADKLVSSNVTLYSCRNGYSPNTGSNAIICVSDNWTITSFQCNAVLAPTSDCLDPPDIPNADKLVSSNVTLYSCRNGYTPNTGSNVIMCLSNNWTTTSFQCNAIEMPVSDCPDPPDIVNADKLVSYNVTLYSCQNGYSPNTGSNAIVCVSNNWTTTSFQCNASPICTNTVTTVYNITMQQRIEEIKKELTVEIKNTSLYRRSLVCASDPRTSAAQMGYLGIIILSGTMMSFILLDILTFCK